MPLFLVIKPTILLKKKKERRIKSKKERKGRIKAK